MIGSATKAAARIETRRSQRAPTVYSATITPSGTGESRENTSSSVSAVTVTASTAERPVAPQRDRDRREQGGHGLEHAATRSRNGCRAKTTEPTEITVSPSASSESVHHGWRRIASRALATAAGSSVIG